MPKTDAQLVMDIKKFIGHKEVRSIYIDPAAASLKIAMRNENLPVIDANNDVLLGIKTMNKFVSGKNIVVHKSCKNPLNKFNLIDGMLKLQKKEKTGLLKKMIIV